MAGPRHVQVAVGALIVRKRAGDEQVLLIRRGNPPAQGRWTLPGGRVRPGESLAEAAARETEEETGLPVAAVGERIDVIERIGSESHHVIIAYRVVVDSAREPTAGDDAAEARWIARTTLAELETTRGLEDFLDRYAWGEALPTASDSEV